MTYEAGPMGPAGQRVRLGPSPWALVLAVIGGLIGGFGAARGVNTSSSVVAGVVGGVVLLAGLAGLTSWTEIRGGLVIVHSLRRRRTLRLGRLASADLAVGRGRYGPFQTLTLADQPGTKVALTLTSYGKATRQRALAALAPALMASGVRRTGPIEQALAGSL